MYLSLKCVAFINSLFLKVPNLIKAIPKDWIQKKIESFSYYCDLFLLRLYVCIEVGIYPTLDWLQVAWVTSQCSFFVEVILDVRNQLFNHRIIIKWICGWVATVIWFCQRCFIISSLQFFFDLLFLFYFCSDLFKPFLATAERNEIINGSLCLTDTIIKIWILWACGNKYISPWRSPKSQNSLECDEKYILKS